MCVLKSNSLANKQFVIVVTQPRSRIIGTWLCIYMTVHGMQQHEQSSVERQLHLPGWGFTTEPAAEEIVEAGILMIGGAEGSGSGLGLGLTGSDSWVCEGVSEVVLSLRAKVLL